MGLAALPLHVWDRELDSRILLATLLLNDGHQILLGHEYNMAPIYKQIPSIFHFGAGRPIYNEPRTNHWYEPIIENHGYVGLVFEEGINDIMLNSSVSFPGINDRSVSSTSHIFAWCHKEITQMCESTGNDLLSQSLIKCSEPSSNTRIELLGDLGTSYYKDYISSLDNIFGDYVLISDNFALEIFGVGAPLSIDNELRWTKDKQKSEVHAFHAAHHKSALQMRTQFAQVVNQLVADHPHIHFIFRPHPVADPSYWYMNLLTARNLTILCRDNAVPWIKKATAVVHSGCTLGFESEFANVPAIDISRLFDDQRKPGVSNIVSRYKPLSYHDLINSLTDALSSQSKSQSISIPNQELEILLSSNIDSLNPVIYNYLDQENLGLPRISSLLKIRALYKTFFELNNKVLPYDPSVFASLVTKVPPLPGKSKYYNASTIVRKLKAAFSSLGVKKQISLQKYSGSNVFLMTPR